MYHHVKKLMYAVRVDVPDPSFGNMLLEQFGGATGELAAAMQYSIQGSTVTIPSARISSWTSGLKSSVTWRSCALARLHLKPVKFDREHTE